MDSSGGNGWRFGRDGPPDSDYYQQVSSPLKFYVLDFVNKRGNATYDELADDLGMPTHYACDRLVRYARRGLLSRDRRGDGGISVFEVTEHGHERLAYFRRQATSP